MAAHALADQAVHVLQDKHVHINQLQQNVGVLESQLHQQQAAHQALSAEASNIRMDLRTAEDVASKAVSALQVAYLDCTSAAHARGYHTLMQLCDVRSFCLNWLKAAPSCRMTCKPSRVSDQCSQVAIDP